jgi:hypothetical protein
MSDPIVRFVGIGKTYGGISRVVDDLHLDIQRGELLTQWPGSGVPASLSPALIRLARRPAAVDAQRVARDERSGRRGQEDRRTSHFGQLAKASHRCA